MKTWSKVILASITAGLILVAAGSATLTLVDVREIGRTDPKRAASYSPPLFNFSESYVEGAVLGVIVGSTKSEAIQAVEKAGLTVSPSGWGDNRAGGASLYDSTTLLKTMLRQPYLNFHHVTNISHGMTIHFNGDRVQRIDIHYINSGL